MFIEHNSQNGPRSVRSAMWIERPPARTNDPRSVRSEMFIKHKSQNGPRSVRSEISALQEFLPSPVLIP